MPKLILDDPDLEIKKPKLILDEEVSPEEEPVWWEKAWGTLEKVSRPFIPIPKVPEEEPTWWEEAVKPIKETLAKGYEWLYPEGIVKGTLEAPKYWGKALEKVGLATGEGATWIARNLCPGQEDLPPYEEQPPARQALTLAQGASVIALATIIGDISIRTLSSLARSIAYGRVEKIADKVAIKHFAKIKATNPEVKTLEDAKALIDASLRTITSPAIETTYMPTTMRELGKLGKQLLKPLPTQVPTAEFKAALGKQVTDIVTSLGKILTPEIIKPFTQIIEQAVGTPATGMITPEFGAVAVDVINKDFPMMLNELIAGEEVTAPLKPELIPEERIVEKLMPERLTPTAEEFAIPEIAPKGKEPWEMTWDEAEAVYVQGLLAKSKDFQKAKENWERADEAARTNTIKSKQAFLDLAKKKAGNRVLQIDREADITVTKLLRKAKTSKDAYEKLANLVVKEVAPEVKPTVPEEIPSTGVKPPIPPTPPPKELPQFGEEPVEDPIVKLNELIKQAKPLRGKLEAAYTEERTKRIAEVDKFIEEQIDTVGGEEGYKAILSKLKGELVPSEAKIAFEPVKEKLTFEQLKALYVRTWKHPYLDNWEKISAADGLTRLLGGEIPQPKQLVLLEEVYGTELIKNILTKRTMGAKALNFALELANLPRAMLATADMSAFLRQGIIPIIAHPVISAKAIGKTFQFAFSPKSFEQYFKDLPENPLYPLMRKAGVDITDPSKVGMTEREEPFISRLLQNMPIIGEPVKFAERAYVGFLNKVRVDLFKVWADELLSEGLSPIEDIKYFKAAANVINTFTARGSLGALNKITPQLNILFFSPRLNAGRFNALNPVWYIKQPKGIRKKAIGDFAKFVVAGLTTLALIKVAAGDKVSVETDPRSSDFGKIRIGNTRWDIWGGFQQWARVFTQIIMGERKSATTGEIISLNKDEFPFTTRKEVLLRFIEGKAAPVPALVNELMSGVRTWVGEPMTPETVLYEKFMPMWIQDTVEAYVDGGLGKAVGAGIPAFFGVGVQTWGEEWKLKYEKKKEEILLKVKR